MTEPEKRAYRCILYHALLEIRPVEWLGRSWRDRLLPTRWIENRRRVRMAGALADWLHNLALFSALEFEGFDQEWFWTDYDRILRRHGRFSPTDYRRFFADRKKDSEKEIAERKAAQPGATDNPDDAQRLREDH